MSEKLSDWFDGEVNPSIPGVYERCWKRGKAFSYPFYMWDGAQWIGRGCTTAKEAAKESIVSIFQSHIPWRGLAEKPEA